MTKFVRQTPLERRLWGDTPASKRGQRAQQLPKNVSASKTPNSMWLVYAACENALIIQLSPTATRGYASVFGLLGIAGAALPVAMLDSLGSEFLLALQQGSGYVIPAAVLGLACVLTALAGATLTLRAFRFDLLSPKKVPLVLNRKTRKVYKVMPEVPALEFGPIKLLRTLTRHLKPWPLVLIEYDWDCLEAEYFEETTLAGNVVKTYRHLQLYIKAAPNSDEVWGSFTLVSPMTVGKEQAMNLWEHIRRYMEEGGPPLSPGDEPSPPYPRNPISAMQTVMPYVWPAFVIGLYWGGSQFVEQGLFRMWPMDFLSKADVSITAFGVTLVSFVIVSAGLFNWLAHLLAPSLTLPPEVTQDAGAPLDMKQLAREAKAAVG